MVTLFIAGKYVQTQSSVTSVKDLTVTPVQENFVTRDVKITSYCPQNFSWVELYQIHSILVPWTKKGLQSK